MQQPAHAPELRAGLPARLRLHRETLFVSDGAQDPRGVAELAGEPPLHMRGEARANQLTLGRRGYTLFERPQRHTCIAGLGKFM